MILRSFRHAITCTTLLACLGSPANAQETDVTQTPNAAGAGAKRSYVEQAGAGRGDLMVPDSSSFLIARDPFRSIRRGRNLFQRKFTVEQGLGPRMLDGLGDIETQGALGAGLSDSCASCHGRPRGSAGVGGDVFTRPDSRDAPHLFGLGLVEMLADEISRDLRGIRRQALELAAANNRPTRLALSSKGVEYGFLTALPDGRVETDEVVGVDPDLRVRPFFHHGGTISIREFVVGALRAEMGLEAVDPDLLTASRGGRIMTPAGMVLDGTADRIEAPPVESPSDDGDGDGVANEVPASIVDHLEFYLLNYFKPATYLETAKTRLGERTFDRIGCTSCHVPDLVIERDRRVADVETHYDPSARSPQRTVRGRDRRVRRERRRIGVSHAQTSSWRALRRARYLRGLQATRSGPVLPRTELRDHGLELRRFDAAGVHDRAAMGGREHGALRPRRSQHQPPRGDPAARW